MELRRGGSTELWFVSCRTINHRGKRCFVRFFFFFLSALLAKLNWKKNNPNLFGCPAIPQTSYSRGLRDGKKTTAATAVSVKASPWRINNQRGFLTALHMTLWHQIRPHEQMAGKKSYDNKSRILKTVFGRTCVHTNIHAHPRLSTLCVCVISCLPAVFSRRLCCGRWLRRRRSFTNSPVGRFTCTPHSVSPVNRTPRR